MQKHIELKGMVYKNKNDDLLPMKIAVVKYNAGNIYSVDYALKRLGVEAIITSDKETLMSADKIIFPGVEKLPQP